MLVINWRCALRCPLSHVRVLLGGRRVTGSAITTQLAPRLPAAVGSAASEVMMLGSGEFVMLLLRCCLLLMRWLLMLLLLLRPRGRTGARPMRAFSPSVGANSIISSRRNVLLGCTECAVRALSEKVRGGCVHSLYPAGPGVGRVREFKPCRHCEFEFVKRYMQDHLDRVSSWRKNLRLHWDPPKFFFRSKNRQLLLKNPLGGK